MKRHLSRCHGVHGNGSKAAFPAWHWLLLAVLTSLATISAAAQPAQALLGRWDVTLTTPKGDLPSWIEIVQEDGQPKITMVGLTDHATPLQRFTLKGDALEFVSPKNEEGFDTDTFFKGKLVGQHLVGTVTNASGAFWTWKGERAPAMMRTGAPRWGQPISLFNGKDLTGWTPRTPSGQASWKVEDGTLVKDGNGPDLVSSHKFEDFKLHIEWNCGPDANSGVYLRGRYEVQVETESAAEPDSHHTGGVYGYLDPLPEQPRKPGVWQSFDITLIGRKVTVVQNGVTVIDGKEIPGITGGALDSREGTPGPIYLQASEKGRVAYRNIIVTPATY